jgi:hypothetical protein
MTNEKFDDDLFRTYFVRIYKNLVNMETDFINALEETDRPFFVSYANSLSDMARFFKVTTSKDLT